MKTKFFNALSLAVIMAMLFTSLALADNVQNDVTTDPASITLQAGVVSSYVDVQFYIQQQGAGADGDGGCNFDTSAEHLTFTINTPLGVTADPASLTFNECHNGADLNAQTVRFKASAGAVSGNISFTTNENNSGGTFNYANAIFYVNVETPPPSDTTAPVISYTVNGLYPEIPDGLNGWYVSDVTVSWTVNDPESTVTSTTGCGTTNITADTLFAGITLTCSATSAGGTSSQSVTIKRDATAPSASASASPAPNGNGWNNTDVTVNFSGSDGLSGIASCSDPVVLSSEGAGQSASGSCTDNAGNSASATASGINIDKTAPTLAPTVSPNPVLLNGSAAASANASDSLSGVASSSCDSVNTSSVGSYSVNCTATDNAGNSISASAGYSVIYNWNGFFQPVDNNVMNIAKAGQAIPLKWRLTDANGNPVTNLTSVKVTVAGLACATGTSTDQIEEYAAGASGLQNLGDGYYQFNWKTPTSYASSCKTMYLNLGDGALHTALFQFKK